MSVATNKARHSTYGRTATTTRRVVVPDRMIRRTQVTSPIINMQPASLPQKNSSKPTPNIHREPIASSKVHKITQKNHQKQITRPVAPHTEVDVINAMNSLLERHNALPKHLARTAGRAHLLSAALQVETKRVRWHQKILAGFAS